jgi:apolipoprotein D and lipocalin family protein
MRALLLTLLLCGCSTAIVAPLLPSYREPSAPIGSLAGFDPARWAGRWHEIASFPVPFQAGCAGALAEYGPPVNGSLSVLNTCLDPDGRPRSRIAGTATVSGPGRLSVRLDGVPFTAPLWVLWVDADYRTAVLGQPDGRAGWILNRTPHIPSDRLRAALDVLAFNGYDTSRLRFAEAASLPPGDLRQENPPTGESPVDG